MPTNVELKKNTYRNRILGIVRQHGQVSRFDLKKQSRYSMTTTLDTVEALLHEGLITESGVGESTGGRKPTWISINPQGGYFLGVEFNAEHIYSVILDFSGNVTYRALELMHTSPSDAQEVIVAIKAAISAMLGRLNGQARIFGIGLGIPGFLDIERGISLGYMHITHWENVALKEEIERAFGLRVYVENNVNAMVLAHKWLDYAGLCDDMLLLAVRSGIRMGSIAHNRLLRGRNNAAGEIDHLRLPSSQRPCTCGRRGCLVAEVSNGAILAKMREGIAEGRFPALAGKAADLTLSDFMAGLHAADPDCMELLRQTARFIGEALCYAVMANNPARILLSTDWMDCNSEWVSWVIEVVRARCPVYSLRNLVIDKSQYGAHVGAIGAASIVMQKEIYYSPTSALTDF